MLSTPRPPSPREFQREAEKAREALHAALQAHLASAPLGRERYSELFDGKELWRDARFKPAFAPGGLAKCAYCDRQRDLQGELHVDHFRPKSVVCEWTEEPPEVSDRPVPLRKAGIGYWWLAYDWRNLALACWTCNAYWKRTLFPVALSPFMRPLLLHPHEPFRPGDHFRWDISGHVSGVTNEGRATIATCGLNRAKLVAARSKVFRDVAEVASLIVLARRARNQFAVTRGEERLLHLGAKDREFTGMVRWVIEDRLRIDASDLFGDS